jgi:hypothetical protein
MSNNTSAFPSTFHNGWGEPEKGMTLRDYFAIKVLQGLLASGLDQPKFEFARKSYEMADAMLKAREA